VADTVKTRFTYRKSSVGGCHCVMNARVVRNAKLSTNQRIHECNTGCFFGGVEVVQSFEFISIFSCPFHCGPYINSRSINMLLTRGGGGRIKKRKSFRRNYAYRSYFSRKTRALRID